MISIQKKDIIPLLRDSELCDQFENEVTVPEKYLIKNYRIKIEYEKDCDNHNFNSSINKLIDVLKNSTYVDTPELKITYEFVIVDDNNFYELMDKLRFWMIREFPYEYVFI